jgi:nicotinamide-nucleotide amidase
MAELLVLSQNVGEVLQLQGLVLVTAESCTGGGLASAITEVPGSSAWFDRGFVTYSNLSKVELLEVEPQLLYEQGAVSEAVVRAMAQGALNHSVADLAVAISGVAGPQGGTPEKPVGTVCLAWQRRGRNADSRLIQLPGNRVAVREAAIRIALEGVLARLSH